MGDASARLQTSANILGTAKDNFFREPGNVLDEAFVRALSTETLSLSTNFNETARESGLSVAAGELLADATITLGTGVGSALAGSLANISASDLLGPVGQFGPDIVTGILNDISGTDFTDFSHLNSRLTSEVVGSWPGWPSVNAQWPGWPSVRSAWGGWPDVSLPGDFWPDVSLPNNFWPEIDVPSFGGGGGGGGGDNDPFGFVPGIASGGRVQQTGVAQVHRGELVTDEQRLVDELASAIGQTSGGGGADTSAIESKLDRLHSDLQTLQQAMDVSLTVDKETLGRATNDARQNRMGDTDPTV